MTFTRMLPRCSSQPARVPSAALARAVSPYFHRVARGRITRYLPGPGVWPPSGYEL